MNEVQQVILTIFKEIDKICQNHSIPYYAIGGTCIGAVRHKGFIPWDDDLDIAIPIEHYFEFLDIARIELPEHLYVRTSFDVIPDTNIFSKICDSRTTFIEKKEFGRKECYKGIFVDIMPISGIPENKGKRRRFYRKITLLDKFNVVLRNPYTYDDIKGFLIRFPFRFLQHILPFTFFSKRYYKILKSNPFEKAELTGYVWTYQWVKRLTFPKSYFGDGVYLSFEDCQIKCPKKYHEYLTQQFGDYMVLPKEEDRIVHNGIVDVHKPYMENN